MTRTVPNCCPDVSPYWQLAPTDEKGWHCSVCRAALGFRPDLDRSDLYAKVWAILDEVQEHQLDYVSNASLGEFIIHNVMESCQGEDAYDQGTILRLIATDPNLTDGTKFWQEEARRWLAGEPTQQEVWTERNARLLAGQLELPVEVPA